MGLKTLPVEEFNLRVKNRFECIAMLFKMCSFLFIVKNYRPEEKT